MEGLIKNGLHTRVTGVVWLVPSNEDRLVVPDGYVILFMHFHEHGLASSPHKFLRGLLHHYGIELQHLNLNGVQHISAFIALYEGYLGIEPHFELWKYFFAVELQRKKMEKKKSANLAVPMGCASIRL
jgi:hypothetical protein